MATEMGRPRAVLSWVLSLVLLGGCEASPSAPSPEPVSPSPTSPSFELEVLPSSFVGPAIGGQRVVFLVRAIGLSGDAPVELAATATSGTVSIERPALDPGMVGEVTVVPAGVPDGSERIQVDVTIVGRLGVVERTVRRAFNVAPGTDGLGSEAAAHLAPFAEWLRANRPELGIDGRTAWDGTPGSWVLVVDHYAFFSPVWELELSWHVMVPPDDWARIALRRRWSDARPSVAFEISSFARGDDPHEIEPPDAVWR